MRRKSKSTWISDMGNLVDGSMINQIRIEYWKNNRKFY